MLRDSAVGLLICTLILCVYPLGTCGYSHCNCYDEGFWTNNIILECQKISDFFIAIAYFSIPIELVYFISCSNIPFKWVLVQFIAFIVLCGMTHLLNGWTYYGPHSFQLVMSLTIFKFLTALVSCATAITLLTLIPLLLKVKVRELFLTQNVLELDQEVGMMRKKKEASLHVRMLTRQIRKSLDKHTILYTTLVELSKSLDLQNCAVWMPNEDKTRMYLSHELKASSSKSYPISIPVKDSDVEDIKVNKGVRILRSDSPLGKSSTGGFGEAGSVAAIRVPILHVSNFKGGTPEVIQACYAILVLVLPNDGSRMWSSHELEIVECVADQVAVALSHASVLEESQLMRDKLAVQNRALQQAKKDAMMASQARNAFQKVMSHGMRRPMHSVFGFLSVLQEENLKPEQRLLLDSMARTANVLSTLTNDVIDIPVKDDGRFPLQMRTFRLHSMIKEASCLARSLFISHGIEFSLDVQCTLPDRVIGDETRAFQVILHIVGYLLYVSKGGGSVTFRVTCDSNVSEGKNDKRGLWRQVAANDYANVKFEFEISGGVMQGDLAALASRNSDQRHGDETKEMLSFTMCKKLVQMMQGNIWISLNSFGLAQTMNLFLRFQVKRFPDFEKSPVQPRSNSIFRGLRILLADDDDINRAVTKKLLEKLGCQVFSVPSGVECLSVLGPGISSFQVVFLDLYMPRMDGFEVATRIRQLNRNNNWPIIVALTASAEENIVESCFQKGINGLIRKPVVLQGIADELRRILMRQASEGV